MLNVISFVMKAEFHLTSGTVAHMHQLGGPQRPASGWACQEALLVMQRAETAHFEHSMQLLCTSWGRHLGSPSRH